MGKRLTIEDYQRTDFAGQLDLHTGEALSTDVVRPKAPAPVKREETGALVCQQGDLFEDDAAAE